MIIIIRTESIFVKCNTAVVVGGIHFTVLAAAGFTELAVQTGSITTGVIFGNSVTADGTGKAMCAVGIDGVASCIGAVTAQCAVCGFANVADCLFGTGSRAAGAVTIFGVGAVVGAGAGMGVVAIGNPVAVAVGIRINIAVVFAAGVADCLCDTGSSRTHGMNHKVGYTAVTACAAADFIEIMDKATVLAVDVIAIIITNLHNATVTVADPYATERAYAMRLILVVFINMRPIS